MARRTRQRSPKLNRVQKSKYNEWSKTAAKWLSCYWSLNIRGTKQEAELRGNKKAKMCVCYVDEYMYACKLYQTIFLLRRNFIRDNCYICVGNIIRVHYSSYVKAGSQVYNLRGNFISISCFLIIFSLADIYRNRSEKRSM